jgi:hypothetical protein
MQLKPINLVTPGLLLMALCAGAGSTIEEGYAERAAKKQAEQWNAEKQRLEDTYKEREKHLTELLETERRDHQHDNESRSRHLAAVTAHSNGLRAELQARLAGAEHSGESCQRRADAIAEAAGELIDLAVQGDGLLQEAAREAESLRRENQRLAKQVDGWQQRERDRHQVITVTSKR